EKVLRAEKWRSRTKHESKTPGVEKQPAQTSIDDTFHQNIHRLARSAKTRFKHRESCLHPKYKERRHQCPDRINRIYDVIDLEYGRRCISSSNSSANNRADVINAS